MDHDETEEYIAKLQDKLDKAAHHLYSLSDENTTLNNTIQQLEQSIAANSNESNNTISLLQRKIIDLERSLAQKNFKVDVPKQPDYRSNGSNAKPPPKLASGGWDDDLLLDDLDLKDDHTATNQANPDASPNRTFYY